jgi:hypothetical protein
MRPDAPYFIILLCLTPEYFARQGENAVIQWVKLTWIILFEDLEIIPAFLDH